MQPMRFGQANVDSSVAGISRNGDIEASIGCQVLTSTDERDPAKKFTALLANLLAIVTGRSLRGLNRCSAGRLAFGESSIGV